MKRLILLRALCFSPLWAFVSAAELHAALPEKETISGWTLIPNDYECSLSRHDSQSFVLLVLNPDGTEFLRLHDKSWKFKVDAPVALRIIVGQNSLDLPAKGAPKTTNGAWGVLTKTPMKVIEALSTGEQISISADGQPLSAIDLSGLSEAYPRLEACVAPLKSRPVGPPDEMPAKPLRLLRQPSFSASELLQSEHPSSPLEFELTVGVDGVPTQCVIKRSSGSSIVDERACALLKERARFKPALNAAGKPVVSSYRSAIAF